MVLGCAFGPKTDKTIGDWTVSIMRSFTNCTHHQYCSGDPITKNEIGGACQTKWGQESSITGFWWGNTR